MNNISVTDNRTITVVINGTEHKLAIKEAEVLRDALVKALPNAARRSEYDALADLIKSVKFERINSQSWTTSPFPPTHIPYQTPQVWCGITDDHGHRAFL